MVATIQHLGQGTQLVKLDLQNAYRIVPIHPHDHHLLGIAWEGRTYIDRVLPFGLRSAPKIFSAVADMMAWALHWAGIRHLTHYIDDFLFLGAPGTEEGAEILALALRIFQILGVPVAAHKMRELFRLLHGLKAPHHHVHLSAGARADIAWWRCLLQHWNGTSFFPLATASSHMCFQMHQARLVVAPSWKMWVGSRWSGRRTGKTCTFLPRNWFQWCWQRPSGGSDGRVSVPASIPTTWQSWQFSRVGPQRTPRSCTCYAASPSSAPSSGSTSQQSISQA